MDLLLGEELLLLSLDPDGTARLSAPCGLAIGASTLVELSLRARLSVAADGTVAAGPDVGAVGVPVLDDALAVIRNAPPATASTWTGLLREPSVTAAHQALLAQGLVREERVTTWRLFTSTRHPESDAGPEQAVRDRLHAVLVGGREPDQRTAALAVLLHAGRLQDLVTADEDEAVAVSARLAEIADGHWAPEGVHLLSVALMVSGTAMMQTAVHTALFVSG